MLGSTNTAYAQVDFSPSYIVRPAGDTVRGQVDYRSTYRSLEQCLFRPASGTVVISYLLQQLRG